MTERIRGVVLRQWRYNDESVIVNIYTNKYGSISTLVRKRPQKKTSVRNTLFQPLNMLEFDIAYNLTQPFHKIREVRPVMSYSSLPYEPLKGMLALFLSDFLYHSLRSEVQNASLFEFICFSLEWLDKTSASVANFHLAFMIRMARFMGFWPNVSDYESGMVFDLKDAVMCNSLPAHGMYLEAAEAGLIPSFLRMNYQNMHLFRLNRLQRSRILDILVQYYRVHVPNFNELKSLEVLRELMS